MKATVTVVNPDHVQLTIAITMPVATWRNLREQLDSKWPSWAFSALIGKSIDKALGQVTAVHESESA